MPTIPDTFLWALQPVVADYLLTEELFRDIPMVTEDAENVADQVEQALSGVLKGPTGKHGLAIIIHAVRHGGGVANIPAAFNQEAAVVFGIAEVPVLNRSPATNGIGLPGLVVAELLVAVMKSFASSEIATTFWEPDKAIALPRYDPDTGLVMHVVTMHCHGGIQYSAPLVATPVITLSSTEIVNITCATAGAIIYFTTDGTRPTNTNGEQWDAGPEDISLLTQPVTVRARAYKTGSRASLIAINSND